MKIHFIGIGGIGISALAQYYLAEGHAITGSDLVVSETIEFLQKKGIKLTSLTDDADLVVYSPAIKPEHIEFSKAKKLGIKILSYPEALGELTRKYNTIAVSGAHGKSTTTALVSLAMVEAGLDPTVIVGTKLKEFGGTNFRKGQSNYLVIEADEFSFSFLNYRPKTIILTNIDEEHLDCYKDLDHILETFKKYVLFLEKDGVLIVNEDDKNIQKLIENIGGHEFKLLKYGFNQKNDVDKLKEVLQIPGKHNISNALAVLALSRLLKIDDQVSFKALGEYKGAWRRFEINEATLNGKKFTLINDYGHHPTEVMATLSAAREKYKNEKIWCIFQPHQYQRTYYLYDQFVKVTAEAPVDKFLITDIYEVAGR